MKSCFRVGEGFRNSARGKSFPQDGIMQHWVQLEEIDRFYYGDSELGLKIPSSKELLGCVSFLFSFPSVTVKQTHKKSAPEHVLGHLE